MEFLIGITLIVLLIVLVAFALTHMHIDVNNLMANTSHLVDRPPAWRWGKPPTARNRRNKRKSK